ncbi:Phosphatidylglycerol/phosphatidylinositol transfer protein [Tephrocybe sp. NHM501043]|nr:Phosphatidylglycerol/phosphatidylinositol transfer protein [Tephrocybe sp. NHM501043]
MVRIPFVAILGLSTASFALANPIDPQVAIQADSPVHINDKWSYTNCGSTTDPIQIESIEVSPDPPVPGKDLTVKVTGRATETIEEGAYADVTVKLGLIKLLQKQFDVCDEARKAKASVQCPVETGNYIVEHTVALPREIPRAKFTVNVQGYTADDDDMLCLDLHVDFIKNPFPHLGW